MRTISNMAAFLLCFLAWGACAEEVRECVGALNPKPIEAELLAQIDAEVASDPLAYRNGQSRAWTISREGREVGFIYGTSHQGDLRSNYVSTPIYQKLSQASDAAFEAELLSLKDKDWSRMKNITKKYLIDKSDQKFLSLIEARSPGLIDNVLQTIGVTRSQISGLSPRGVELIISSKVCADSILSSRGFGPILDTILQVRALLEGKRIHSLETIRQGLQRVFSRGDDDEEAEVVSINLTRALAQARVYNYLSLFYTQDKIDSIIALDRVLNVANEKQKDAMKKRFLRIMTQSNKRFADGIDDLLKTSDYVFIAVGAGHLIGKQGIIDMLIDRGYSLDVFRTR